MKNKLLIGSLVLFVIATVLGIVSTAGIDNQRELLRSFHLGSTSLFLGLLGVGTLVIAKLWNEDTQISTSDKKKIAK